MQSAARRVAEGCAQQFEGFLFREDQEKQLVIRLLPGTLTNSFCGANF